MQPCACAAPYEQSMSYGTFCINSAPNTGPQREKHNQTLVTGQLKYNWESVLSLNICDTGKKSHKKSESYNSKERTTNCERRQKQEAVAGLTEEHVTGCSCQARITSRQTWKEHNSPYSRLFNAKRKLREKKANCPLRHEHRGLSVPVCTVPEATQKANSRTKSWISWVTAKYSNHNIFCPWRKGK